jgi:predicted amidohydrolase
MILASAQTKPTRGDIFCNLNDHYRLIEIASGKGADLIAFPELSISGYERENAAMFTFSENDTRLDKLASLANNLNMIIIAGAPLKTDVGIYICSFVFQPGHPVKNYTKQFLHPGEEISYISSFHYNPTLEVEEQKISLAICADIDHPEHAESAAKSGSSIYIPSIFFSPGGIPAAYEQLSSYAKDYSLCVLMSNFSGESWGQPSGGRSAFWNNDGKLVAAMNDSDSGLLIVEKTGDIWKGQTIIDK